MYACMYVKEAWEDIDIPWRWWTNWHSQYKEEQLGNPYIYSTCENFESGAHCQWCQPEFVLVHHLNRSPWTVLPKHLSAANHGKTTLFDNFYWWISKRWNKLTIYLSDAFYAPHRGMNLNLPLCRGSPPPQSVHYRRGECVEAQQHTYHKCL